MSIFDGLINVSAPYNVHFLTAIKSIPGRKWNGPSKSWQVPESAQDAVLEMLEKYYPNQVVKKSWENLPVSTTYVSPMQVASRTILDQWDDITKSQQADRVERMIVTGNILQGLTWSGYKGILTSYTTLNGQVKKGILLPDEFEVKLSEKVSVPIDFALPILKATPYGQSMTTSDSRVSLFHRTDGNWTIIAPGSASQGGDIFLDREMIRVAGNFEKVGDKMRTNFPDTILQEVVAVMGTKGFSMPLTREQYDRIKHTLPIRGEKEIFEIPKKKAALVQDDGLEQELELEALAIEIELELLMLEKAA